MSLLLYFIVAFLISAGAWAQGTGYSSVPATGVFANVKSGTSQHLLGQYTLDTCPLTDAAHIVTSSVACASDATKSVANNSITPSVPGRILDLPTGLLAGGGQDITWFITQPSGGGLILGAGFRVSPGGIANWSTIAGKEDWLVCKSKSASLMGCSVLPDMAPPASPIAVVGTPAVNGCAGGSLSTTCAATSPMAVLAGETLVAVSGDCSAVDCITAGTGHVASIASSGTATVGTWTVSAGSTGSTVSKKEIWKATVTGSGNTTPTITYSSSVAWSSISLFRLSGVTADDGVGNAATGTGQAPSVALSGATTQANEFLIFGQFCAADNTGEMLPAGYTDIFAGDIGYNKVNSIGTNSATGSCPAAGQAGKPWAAAITAFR